ALLSYFAAGFLAMPIWYAVARRCGRLWSWRLGLLLSAVLFSLGLGLGDGDGYWFIAISIGTGMMLGADQAIPSTMQTTLAQRLMAEQPNTAVAARLFALWSMLNKAAMGLAVGVAYLWLGTQQTGVGTPPPEWAICAAYIVAPVVLKLLVFVLLGRPQMAYLGHEDGGDV
ncbi:MAG: MFS transporter, partial [Spongiibacter sp.]|nr:MFS transporter [Spongiibacter sp.]